MKKVLLVCCNVLVTAVVGCSQDADTSTAIAADTPAVTVQSEVTATPVRATPPPTTTPYVVPEYWIREDSHRYITVIVPTRYGRDGMIRIMREVVDLHASEEGGWHVNIDCGTSADSTGGTRLGRSSFALDNLGLAQTGLKQKFQPSTIMNDGARCD